MNHIQPGSEQEGPIEDPCWLTCKPATAGPHADLQIPKAMKLHLQFVHYLQECMQHSCLRDMWNRNLNAYYLPHFSCPSDVHWAWKHSTLWKLLVAWRLLSPLCWPSCAECLLMLQDCCGVGSGD